MKRPELLVPASSLEVLKVAVIYGADAVYIGGEAFGLRAKAKNFSKEDMREGIAFAHAHGVKVYVTVNILAHNRDLEGVREYLQELKEIGPDALIIADPGIFMYAKEICPEIERHISTQANNTNYETYRFWYNLGAKRVVSARELSLEEIREIRAHIPDDMEIETFIHGAMCISYSGRCLLSNFMAGRDANQGACTHPCRWKYSVVEEKRPGEYMPVFENERGTFIFNSKDLCMVEHMEDILTSGIDSLKIEGRMKTALYVATVARTYRKAIDDCMESPEKYHANMPWYQEQISNCTYRQFTTGFFYGKPDENTQIYDNNTYQKEYTYLGFAEAVDDRGFAQITQRNKFSAGETIEIMKPDGQNRSVTVKGIYDEEGNPMESAPHAQQKLFVDLGAEISVYDLLRRAEYKNTGKTAAANERRCWLRLFVFKKNTKFLDGVFFDPGDIGPTDGKPVGDFPLSLFFFAEKTVTAADDLIFFWRKNALYRRKEMKNVLLCGIIFDDVYRWAFDDIKQTDLVSFFVRPDRFIQRDFSGTFFSRTEHHQKFVVNAPRSISGKSGGSVNIKSGDCFDQPDRSDGNQIFEIFTCILIFFCNMGDQTKVMFNKDTFCFRIPFPAAFEAELFLCGSQRF